MIETLELSMMQQRSPVYLKKLLSLCQHFSEQANKIRLADEGVNSREMGILFELGYVILEEYLALVYSVKSNEDTLMKQTRNDVYNTFSQFYTKQQNNYIKVDWYKVIESGNRKALAEQIISSIMAFIESRIYIPLKQTLDRCTSDETIMIAATVLLGKRINDKFANPETELDFKGMILGDRTKGLIALCEKYYDYQRYIYKIWEYKTDSEIEDLVKLIRRIIESYIFMASELKGDTKAIQYAENLNSSLYMIMNSLHDQDTKLLFLTNVSSDFIHRGILCPIMEAYKKATIEVSLKATMVDISTSRSGFYPELPSKPKGGLDLFGDSGGDDDKEEKDDKKGKKGGGPGKKGGKKGAAQEVVEVPDDFGEEDE